MALNSGIIVLFCITVFSKLASADETEYRLVRDLMRNYDQRIRPSRNSSDSLNVTFGLALSQIIDVDEKNQIITTNCWLNQAWIDYKLTWDPKKYDGLKVVRLPFDAIWRPDILLYNNADVSAYKSSISTNVMVSNDGNVTWLSMMIFRSSCTINVRFFPFDEQNCTMLFASWTYDGFSLNLVKVGEEGDTTNFKRNSEWTVVKLHVQRNVVYYSCCAEPYPDVTYIIQMRRKPLFYVFNMLMPCMLITFVALLGFYVPSDSGEKVTMGITTLLSMTVFLMLVAENMPATSDVLPLIGLYYGITIGIVSFATGFTVFTLNIHHRGRRGTEVPTWLKKLAFGLLARILCVRNVTLTDAAESQTVREYNLENVPETASNRPNRCSNYMKLRPRHSNSSEERSNSRTTVLDYVPTTTLSTQVSQMTSHPFETDCFRGRENGGVVRGPGVPHLQARVQNMPSSPNLSSTEFERSFIKVLNKVYKTIEKNEMRLAEQDAKDINRQEWQQVALVVDRILLFLFVTVTIGVTLGLVLEAPFAWDFLFNWNDTPDVTTDDAT